MGPAGNALGVVAAVQVGIAGEGEVELADAGEPGGFDVREGSIAGEAEEVVHGCLDAVGFGGHLVDAGGGGNAVGGSEGGEEFALAFDGGLELVGVHLTGELGFEVVDGGRGAGRTRGLDLGEGESWRWRGGDVGGLLWSGGVLFSA